MDRRTFCNWMGVGLIANCFPVALAACTNKNSDARATTNFQAVGTLAQLDKNGQIFNEQIPNSPIFIIRNPDQPKSLVAVNPTCTHRDCEVKWQQEQKIFRCGCHDSQFDFTGKVLNPPADEPLASYEVKVEGQKILVNSLPLKG